MCLTKGRDALSSRMSFRAQCQLITALKAKTARSSRLSEADRRDQRTRARAADYSKCLGKGSRKQR